VRAIADHVQETLAGLGAKPAHVEGADRSEWILLDYFDFIVHVFAPETRTFYALERLWGNAEREAARDALERMSARTADLIGDLERELDP
jgi:ribosome-associated protein